MKVLPLQIQGLLTDYFLSLQNFNEAKAVKEPNFVCFTSLPFKNALSALLRVEKCYISSGPFTINFIPSQTCDEWQFDKVRACKNRSVLQLCSSWLIIT